MYNSNESIYYIIISVIRYLQLQAIIKKADGHLYSNLTLDSHISDNLTPALKEYSCCLCQWGETMSLN
jgi:hypothetical protein